MTWKEWVDHCEKLREEEAKRIAERHGRIKLYILAESIPKNRFVYDRDSDYRKGLRKNLCEELLNECPKHVKSCRECRNFDELMEYLRSKGILIVDCALCPLHRISQTKIRVKAAVNCLKNNNIHYLEISADAPVIAILPKNVKSSLIENLKESLPEIGIRIVGDFQFTRLQGLKSTIEQFLEYGQQG
uniref:Uncharacterized protein n=1 Tax=Archaeoglobus fulgidus TaxID=2234 RepID=A0A7J2TLC4_ARCFL